MGEPLSLKNHAPESLRSELAAIGVEPYRAEQIANWIYVRGVEDFDAMTDLGRDLRVRLAQLATTRVLTFVRSETGADGTTKGVLRTAEGHVIEAVTIPEERRTTLCLSTQVGCPLACSFCATGAMGFTRNLTTAEIIDQVCRMRELLPEGQSITNVVFMGMGEPLLNLPAVVEAVKILLHPKAFALAPRRVTVSTAGLVPKIPELLEQVPVNLAVSLHATTDAVRDVLVPLNRRFPIRVLMETLRGLESITRRRPVFFEYTLLEGVNDSPEDARRLATLLKPLPAKINVIPMNSHTDSPHRPPAADVIDRFMAELALQRMTVTLRRSRGEDIDAACGQLAARETGSGPRECSTP